MLSRHATLALLLTLTTSPLLAAGSVAWRSDLPSAQAEAKQTDKLVLLHFWGDSCGPCRALDKRVFALPSVGNALAANYVPVKVNATEAKQLAATYGVTRVPTDVVLSSDGKVVKSFVSPATPMAYIGTMTQLAATYRSEKSSPYDRIAQAAPMHSGFASNRPAVNEAYRGLSLEQPAATTPPSRYAEGLSPVMSNPYAQPASQSELAGAPSTEAKPAVVPAQSVAPVAPVAKPPIVEPPAAEPPVAPAAEQAAVQLPAGSPPLGFDGYCPVTMKDQWKWAKGDAKWGAIHRGRTYLFSSEANRDLFLSSPDTYSPALQGADPVVAVDSQQSVPGTREYALEYRGKFYFFSSEQTLNKFWTNADGYVQGAQRVAQSLSTGATLTR